LIQSAAFERKLGKAARKKSQFSALALGLMGGASIASMGAKMPGKVPGTGSYLPKVGTVPAQTGALLAKF